MRLAPSSVGCDDDANCERLANRGPRRVAMDAEEGRDDARRQLREAEEEEELEPKIFFTVGVIKRRTPLSAEVNGNLKRRSDRDGRARNLLKGGSVIKRRPTRTSAYLAVERYGRADGRTARSRGWERVSEW